MCPEGYRIQSLLYTNLNLKSSIIKKSHTRTVVREGCKGDEASQWRKPKFDPPPRPNPGRFWWNLVHYIRYWTRLQSRDQKLKFLKFKMAAAAILKIDFVAITYRPIVRFQRIFVWGSRTACRQGLNDKICKFLKSKMADCRHFENR